MKTILYNNKYRIESAPLMHWNYGNNASYFVTICTRNGENFFGKIPDGEMVLSDIGREAEKYWLEIPDNFPFANLDEFILMPNHVHGIITIDKLGGNADSVDAINPDAINRQRGRITGDNNPMIYENLSRILRWYKGRVTYESRKTQTNFSWQARFHDHIIRNERAFEKIRNFITNKIIVTVGTSIHRVPTGAIICRSRPSPWSCGTQTTCCNINRTNSKRQPQTPISSNLADGWCATQPWIEGWK